MKKFSSIPTGRIAAQLLVVGGARAAYDYCMEANSSELAEKIARNQFSPPRSFGPDAAKARAQALVWLAARKRREKVVA